MLVATACTVLYNARNDLGRYMTSTDYSSDSIPTPSYPESNAPVEGASNGPSTSVFVREILETLLFTFFVIWLVKSATQNFRIEGSSMLPTMSEGQYLIINKLAYFLDEPERGDIIVLHFPNDRSRDFIKRIIGLPGDTVEIASGQVKVNGVPINEPYIKDPPTNNQSWTIPENSYFVMGDNRLSSSDSRSWSYLPREDIIGKAWLVYWPVQDWQLVPHVSHPYIPGNSLTVASP